MTWILPWSRRIIFGSLALLMLLPVGCHKEEASSEEEEHAAPVKWETAEKADLEEWTELLGTTQPLPNHSAHVSAPVGGYVLSVLPPHKGKEVVEGHQVEKGQILIRLDDRVLRANRQRLLVTDPELREQIKQAEHFLELARIEVERLENLQRSSGTTVMLVTRQEVDRARLALKDAESKCKGVRSKEDVARAEVKAIDEQLELYTLRAPISGRLGMVHASPGQTLSAGASVAEVVNLDEIDVLCFVPASTVSRLQLNQPVRIEQEGEEISEAVKQEQGRIVFISEQAQVETGTVAIKARFPNQNRKLRANVLLRVQVLTAKESNCTTIPASALLEDQEETAVLVVETEKKKNKKGEEEEEHHVHKLQVKTGLRGKVKDEERVQILGLSKGEGKEKKPVPMEKDMLFVVEGGHGLEDDDLVALKKEEHEEEKKEGHEEDKKEDHKEDAKDAHKEDKKDDRKGDATDAHKEEKKDEK
jgi:RND family efflux transporter MFP subunit